jgi:D-serine deaminase-like pyridoxal phosphate-dependent protein
MDAIPAYDHGALRACWSDALGEIPTPRLLIFRDRVEENLALMKRYLEEIAPGSGFRHLRAHVKTHKSSWTARLQMDRSVARFKATPNEVEMLLRAGARDIFVAYPLLQHQALALARQIAESPKVRFLAQIASPAHAAYLARAAASLEVAIEYLIDLDVGMHRTGAAPAAALALLQEIRSMPGAQRLRFAGLHAYDGHNKGATPEERRRVAGEAMALVFQAIDALRSRGAAVPLLVLGGTPGFLADLEIALSRGDPGLEVEVSPGTWIYWDTNYDGRMPGLFRLAALILAQVMDRPGEDRLTLNLGYKRWAIDAGPVERFSEPGLQVISTNEEHTVLRELPGRAGRRLEIGDHLLIAPRHICSTVNLWEDFTVIGRDGAVEAASCPVDGRNR